MCKCVIIILCSPVLAQHPRCSFICKDKYPHCVLVQKTRQQEASGQSEKLCQGDNAVEASCCDHGVPGLHTHPSCVCLLVSASASLLDLKVLEYRLKYYLYKSHILVG